MNKPHAIVRALVTSLLVAFAFVMQLHCSIVDASDRDVLDQRVGAMPPDVKTSLRIMTTKINAVRWLSHKPSNDRVGDIKCKYDLGDGQGWEDIVVGDGDLLVDYMISCLNGGLNLNYVTCALSWATPKIDIIKNELIFKLNNSPTLKALGADLSKLDVECRYQWDARYDPVTGDVPINCIDPAAVSDDDIINATIGLHHPPPGFLGADSEVLLPYLCPLGAGPGWGCPSVPNNPSDGLSSGGAVTSGGG